MPSDLEKLVESGLKLHQRSPRTALALASTLMAILAILGAYFVYMFLPHTFTLRITSGRSLGEGQRLARELPKEAATRRLHLLLEPSPSTQKALEGLENGQFDAAILPGGIASGQSNILHAAALEPDLLHVLVQPGLRSLEDLRHRRVFLGLPGSDTEKIARRILAFAEIDPERDCTLVRFETTGPQENQKLTDLFKQTLPEAAFVLSPIPSKPVDTLIRQWNYELLEVPFAESLALREPWAGVGHIPAQMYRSRPAVPAQPIATLQLFSCLLVNRNTNPQAVERLLELIFSPHFTASGLFHLDESNLSRYAEYPLSPGTTLYLNRNNNQLSAVSLAQLQNFIAALLSFYSAYMVFSRTLRAVRTKQPLYYDATWRQYFREISDCEQELSDMESAGNLSLAQLTAIMERLSAIRTQILHEYPVVSLEDSGLLSRLLAAVDGARHHVNMLTSRITQSTTLD